MFSCDCMELIIGKQKQGRRCAGKSEPRVEFISPRGSGAAAHREITKPQHLNITIASLILTGHHYKSSYILKCKKRDFKISEHPALILKIIKIFYFYKTFSNMYFLVILFYFTPSIMEKN